MEDPGPLTFVDVDEIVDELAKRYGNVVVLFEDGAPLFGVRYRGVQVMAIGMLRTAEALLTRYSVQGDEDEGV